MTTIKIIKALLLAVLVVLLTIVSAGSQADPPAADETFDVCLVYWDESADDPDQDTTETETETETTGRRFLECYQARWADDGTLEIWDDNDQAWRTLDRDFQEPEEDESSDGNQGCFITTARGLVWK